MAWTHLAITILALAVAGYILLALTITVFQRRLIYKPDPRRITPQGAGYNGVGVWHVPTPDGKTLVAWYAKARPGRPTLIYFHGNAGWIELRSTRLEELVARGYGVLMPSMRSYGGSTGQPSERAIIADAILMYDVLRDSGVAARDIMAFGESLGTGVATQLAALRAVRGLVLDSPYTSMVDLAAHDFPWLPVRYLLWDHFETVRHILRVSAPILILHGEADELVPVGMGRAVYAAAVGPKRLQTYAGAPHLDHLAQGSFDDLTDWIDALVARPRLATAHRQKARG